MADVYIDCEWLSHSFNHEMIIVGAYSPGQGRFQLYGEALADKSARTRFQKFLKRCGNRCRSRDTILFCHGPDFGWMENKLGWKLKRDYCCVNVQKAFNRFTGIKCKKLDHLEKRFHIPRVYNVDLPYGIDRLWFSGRKDRQILLDYNWEDCRNLWKIVKKLETKYPVTRSKFRSISMKSR